MSRDDKYKVDDICREAMKHVEKRHMTPADRKVADRLSRSLEATAGKTGAAKHAAFLKVWGKG